MVLVSRRTSLLVAFAALSAKSVFAGNTVAADGSSSSDAPSLLRASDDDLSALGGSKGGGEMSPLGHRSHSKHYSRVGQIDTVLATITVGEGACPIGSVLSNNQCIITGPSDIACPEGFTEEESAFPGTTPEVIFRNRTCALFVEEVLPLVDCATGSLDGITCFEFSAVAPEFVGCNPNFILQPEGCVFTDVAPLTTPTCNVGELGPGNDCFTASAVAPTLTCDTLAFLGNDGQTCVTRTAAGPATIGCPQGFTLGGDNQCTQVETAGTVPSCEGLPGSLEGGQCVEFEAVAANLNCGEGFELINNGCISFQAQAPTFSCPAGFNSVSDVQCERQIDVPPIAQCSVYEAFFDAEVQQCIVVTQGPLPTLECEEGAVIQDGGCVFVESAAATAFCADPDFILTNTPSGDAQVCQQCLSTGIIGGGISLEDNLSGGHHGHHRAHKHTVEEGKVDQDSAVKPNTAEEVPANNVRRLQEVEATEEEVKAEDETSGQAPPTANSTTYRRDHHHGHHHGSDGEGVFDEVLGGGETFACTTAAPAYQCGTGFVLSDDGIGQTCIQIEIAAGINVCDSGFTLNADQSACEARAAAPAIFSCDAGFTLSADNTQCSITETASKDTQCPAGGELSGDQCVNVPITQDVNLSCGPGRQLQGFDCIAAAAVAAGFACPEGFTFEEGDGTQCTRTNTQPGQGECEAEGANLEGDQCFVYPGVEAEVTCGEGILTDGQCLEFTLVAPATVCAAGYDQVDDQCIRRNVEFPDITCPSGSFIQDGVCVEASGIAAEATCPDGLVAVPIRDDTAFGCFELTAPSAVCPFGQELTVGEECIITASAPNTSPTMPPPRTGGRHGHHGGGGHSHNNAGGHGHNNAGGHGDHNKANTGGHH